MGRFEDKYIDDLCNHRQLSKSEQISLGRTIAESSSESEKNTAKRILATHCYRMVRHLARSFSKNDFHLYQDLFSIGIFELARAADNYDHTRDVKYSTIARRYVICRFLKESAAQERKRAHNFSEIEDDLEKRFDPPADMLVHTEFDAIGAARQALESGAQHYSVPKRRHARAERKWKMFEMVHGLNGYNKMTGPEVARQFRISRERVRQIVNEVKDYLTAVMFQPSPKTL